MSKGKKLIILAVVLLAMIAATVVLTVVRNQQDAANSSEEESSFYYAAETTLISTHEKSEITEIHLKNSEFEGTFTPYTAVEDKKEVQKWTWKENPDITTADSPAGNLASLGSSLKLIKTIDDTKDHLENFGLDKPSEEVTFKYSDGTEETIYIGNTTPDGSYCYATTSLRNDVFTIYKSVKNYASYTTSDLIHNDIPLLDTDGTLISWKAQKQGGRLIYVRARQEGEVRTDIYDTGSYLFESPYTYENAVVNATVMEEYKNYTNPETMSIVGLARTEEEKAAYGLSKEDPAYFVEFSEVVEEEGQMVTKTFSYYFGNTDEEGNIYLCHDDSPIVFTVRKAVLDNYRFDPLDYLQRVIFIAEVGGMNGYSFISTKDNLNYDVTVLRKEEEVSKEESSAAEGESKEESSTETTILEAWYINGQLVDTKTAKNLYGENMGLMIDYEILEKPEYDETDKITITFHRTDGRDVVLEYYRLDDYYYVAEYGDIWVALNVRQFDSLKSKYVAALEE